MASLWEMAIKSSLGRMNPEFDLENLKDVLMIFEIEVLPIQLHHLQSLMKLQMHHHDPFDRLLLAQAQAEGLIFLSKDEKCGLYGLDILW